MGIDNTCPIQEIVKDVLRDARFRQWDFNQFIAMSKWKAKEGLPCNKIFMERMRKRIANGEKNIKEDGMKSTRKGDYMEFTNIAKEFNMEIDVSYYLEQTVGMCAR